MRIVFMGTPGFAVPALEHLIFNGHQVLAVYTRPDKPAGRERAPVFSPVKKAALGLNLPVVQPESLKKPEAIAQLAAYQPEAIVVAAFGQILPPAVLDVPRYGCLNIHPSLLPKCRGASPIPEVLLTGEAFTGVSIMLMDKGMDTGPVLLGLAVGISRWDNTGTLTYKLSQVGARLLQEVLVRWPRQEITPRPQDESGATVCNLIIKEAGEIDWRQPARQIWGRVCAFTPWPGCFTRWKGKQLKIIEAVPLPAAGTVQIGQVITLYRHDLAFGIGTADGILGVAAVQLEGKKTMPAAEFLRGQRDFIGAILPN
ncbi:MAG: methionyl-tRNA formyltransferase [Dehalococcoidales bacterium]|nr:methionyl-tRNA formyltransferase [Dehalococcoidales bacterium]